MKSSSGFAPERGRLRGFNSPIALNTSAPRSLVRKNCVRAGRPVPGLKSNASRGPPPSGLDSAECCDLPRSSG